MDYTVPTTAPTFEKLLDIWNATEKYDREMNFRAWAADHHIEPTGYESDLDAMAAEIYNVRANSPREMTPERWAGIKRRFHGSAKQCLEQAREEMENDS